MKTFDFPLICSFISFVFHIGDLMLLYEGNVEMRAGNLVNDFNPDPSGTAKRALMFVSGVISKKGLCDRMKQSS